jgi:proline-rich protein PRCC
MAKRKHQIGTLFHNARMNELKLMEQKAAGIKSKAETAGKYGW